MTFASPGPAGRGSSPWRTGGEGHQDGDAGGACPGEELIQVAPPASPAFDAENCVSFSNT